MSYFNDWEEFPKTYKWQEAIKFIKLKYKTNNMDSDSIKEILEILIYEGNTVEDEVLTVAVLGHCLENKMCTLEEIKIKYGKNVSEAVYLLTKKTKEERGEYIDRVFKVEKFKYIRKIVLANEIYNLRKLYKNSKEISTEAINHANHILCYKEKTNRELIKKLEEEVKNVRTNR